MEKQIFRKNGKLAAKYKNENGREYLFRYDGSGLILWMESSQAPSFLGSVELLKKFEKLEKKFS